MVLELFDRGFLQLFSPDLPRLDGYEYEHDPMDNERTPLLGLASFGYPEGGDLHDQFCDLVGISSSALPKNAKKKIYGKSALYIKAKKRRSDQQFVYGFTASLSNTLLLSQVILGAALTALGASSSSHLLITVFGALNTVIAGLVAYLKSRGQPMRARMFRDDLERVVSEIENSEVMWLGISRGDHGYDEIDISNEVSVRSEVARLTRLYDRAVRNNTLNEPDMYMAGGTMDANMALRSKPPQELPAAVPPQATDGPAAPPSATPAPVADPDESPATKSKPKTPAKEVPPKLDPPPVPESKPEAVQNGESSSAGASASTPAPPAPAPAAPKQDPAPGTPLGLGDGDEGPATSAKVSSARQNSKKKRDENKEDGRPGGSGEPKEDKSYFGVQS